MFNRITSAFQDIAGNIARVIAPIAQQFNASSAPALVPIPVRRDDYRPRR